MDNTKQIKYMYMKEPKMIGVRLTATLVAVIWVLSACQQASAEIPTQLSFTDLFREAAELPCISGQAGTAARVVKVVDGDTIVVDINGVQEDVRYLDVDTPELRASDPRPGLTASDLNSQLVMGRDVTLVADGQDRDDYGRLLRHVLMDGQLTSYILIRSGNASTFLRDAQTLCAAELQQAMLAAMRERLGIWQNVPDPEPGYGLCPTGCQQPPTGCAVKGNINSKQEKIYHLPAERDYADVEIDPAHGELWFCTIEEAVASGWRPPRAE